MWVNLNRRLTELRPLWHASIFIVQHTNIKIMCANFIWPLRFLCDNDFSYKYQNQNHVGELIDHHNSCDNFLLHFFDDLDRRVMMRPLTLLLVAYPSPLQLTVSQSILFASFSSLWWCLTEPLFFSSLPFSSIPMQNLVPRLFLSSCWALRLTSVLDLNNLEPAGTFPLLLEPPLPSRREIFSMLALVACPSSSSTCLSVPRLRFPCLQY